MRSGPCAPVVHHSFLIYILLRSNYLSSGLVDARVRSVLLSNVLCLGQGVLPSVSMRGLMSLPLFLLVLVGRLDSAVGCRSMSSVNGTRVVVFRVLIYALFVLM
jgi:hypothetical protein